MSSGSRRRCLLHVLPEPSSAGTHRRGPGARATPFGTVLFLVFQARVLPTGRHQPGSRVPTGDQEATCRVALAVPCCKIPAGHTGQKRCFLLLGQIAGEWRLRRLAQKGRLESDLPVASPPCWRDLQFLATLSSQTTNQGQFGPPRSPKLRQNTSTGDPGTCVSKPSPL